MLIASADRYTNMVIGFVLIAVVSRLLTPAQVGVSVIGTTAIALVEMIRDVPNTYLVQRPNLTRAAGRAAFSIMLVVSVLAAAALALSAPWISRMQGDPGVAQYLWVVAAALLLGPIERPPFALMRRNMEFGRIAAVNIANVLTNAVVTIALAALGFGYMSFAWGVLAASMASVILTTSLNPVPWIYRLHLADWREPVRLGAYSGAWGLVRKAMDAVPLIALGQQLNSIGNYGRAVVMSDIPDKLILAGVGPVAYPAIAAEHNAGRSLKGPLLLALGYITAVSWPAYLLLGCLAHPVVALLLGPGWGEVVPLLQILVFAKLMLFFDPLIFSVLFIVGALRTLVFSAVLPLPFFAVSALLLADYGPKAVALCFLAVTPAYSIIGLACLRRAVRFTWGELLAVLGRSAGVTVACMAGPALLLASGLVPMEMSLVAALGIAALAGLGWLLGLWIARHPLLAEMTRLFVALRVTFSNLPQRRST
ncbi:oligosaccharide flippase family protein [Roseicella aquatilis]|uniref:Sugar transporter n=1 Tax=Roseicella aquatilis TaxID=2527868 RepID=A0A4R4DCX0_9PROT|nr:oligosaccharide flippase family protein [Roseicella aquatilis]TCZ57274.1 sugar transporter [Roseicella aquatilis]